MARARMPCPIASFRNRSRKGLKSERIEHEIGNRASLRYAMSTNFEWWLPSSSAYVHTILRVHLFVHLCECPSAQYCF